MTDLYSATIFGSSVYLVSWMFLVCSFLGVIIEGLFFLVQERVLESRTGLLYLPLRPLYGVGGLGFMLLAPVADRPVLVFLLGALVATVVEYVASVVMEKGFGAVSWDYSEHLLNLGGRVCLSYSLCWGVLALVAVYLVDRPVHAVLGALPLAVGTPLLTVLLALTVLSSVLTLAVLAGTSRRVRLLEAGGRGSSIVVPKVWDRALRRLAPDLVLLNSFPRMTLMIELARLTGQDRAWLRVARRPRPVSWDSAATPSRRSAR